MSLEPLEFDLIDRGGPASVFTAPFVGTGGAIEHKCLGAIHACNEAERLLSEGENVVKIVISGHLIDPKHITALKRYLEG
ncbi:hypothetical protein [Pseudaminobacter sp. NGMCC 1.201702]|uniref:hypothetical protein n=1 Tax=Pseudaminobacter sp. NGMCC 1.201702 TaxID=3391825 RepID=UPI0039EF05D9